METIPAFRFFFYRPGRRGRKEGRRLASNFATLALGLDDYVRKWLKGPPGPVHHMSPGSFTVEVVVENKPLARDPEGETIHRNLVLKGGYSQVTSVRAGKLLRMNVEASSPDDARQLVQKLCDDLRIYNPAAHTCEVRIVQ